MLVINVTAHYSDFVTGKVNSARGNRLTLLCKVMIAILNIVN